MRYVLHTKIIDYDHGVLTWYSYHDTLDSLFEMMQRAEKTVKSNERVEFHVTEPHSDPS